MSKKNDSRITHMPVCEGVRFDVGSATAYAVRNEDRDITVRVCQNDAFFRRLAEKIPLLRGIVRMFSCVGTLFASLAESARLDPQTTIRGSRITRQIAELFRTTPQSMAALLSGIAILVILPAFVVGLPMLVEALLLSVYGIPRFAINAVCCAFRVMGAVLAIYMICRLRVVNRLCMYRGAACKVANAYEAYGPNLTHEEVLLSSRLTDKSDGAFLIVVLLLALIGFSCFRTGSFGLQLVFRLSVLLASAAIAGELLRPLERARPDTMGAALRAPVVNLQHLFTIEPHNQMIEVALCAFRAALENDDA